MNENWRDYSKYTDKQLDDLLKGFAGQADYGAVVFEYQRRQNARTEAESKALHEKTQRLARWAMIFAALSGVGTVFGLIQNCTNKPPSSATHSEASISPSITPLKQTEAQEPRRTPAIPQTEQPRTEPITTSTPPEETQQESGEEPSEEQPEESPTPSS